MARDDYESVISNWKWPPKKGSVIAHIKARSKHSLHTFGTYYTKKKELIHGPFRNTPGHNFYMGTIETRSLTGQNLIHTLELKLWHFEVFPICFYREAICDVSYPCVHRYVT